MLSVIFGNNTEKKNKKEKKLIERRFPNPSSQKDKDKRKVLIYLRRNLSLQGKITEKNCKINEVKKTFGLH